MPPLSPVAWSTFQTGVNPGKHNIFDFLTPDPQPTARSSARSRSARRAGRSSWASTGFPWARPTCGCCERASRSGRILSKHGIFSCVQRVPITFPPEKLWGVLLSAMCVPDLRGTQGMFSYYTTRKRDEGEKIGGEVHHVTSRWRDRPRRPGRPQNPLRRRTGELRLPFEVIVTGRDRAVLKIGGASYELRKRTSTPTGSRSAFAPGRA